MNFYEPTPRGSDYLDRMSSLIARLILDYGTVAEMGAVSGELSRTLQDRSAGTDAATGAGDYDLVLSCENDLTRRDAPRLLSHCLVSARRAVVWVVPADDGARLLGPTLTGCLPRAWVEELESHPLIPRKALRDCFPRLPTEHRHDHRMVHAVGVT
ncbi:hypothetical protein ACYQR9_21405 [Methylobacterium sp. CM6241]